MSNTNLVLGANWRLDEWPEFIDVSHEGTCDGMRLYYPERTCKLNQEGFGIAAVAVCDKCGDRFSVYAMAPEMFNYCPTCGAKVVSE